MPFVIGQLVTLSVVFSNSAGVATDPVTAFLKVRDPNRGLVTYNPIRDDVGKFHQDVPLSLSGEYSYRWEASGNITAVGEGSIMVSPSEVL